MTWLRSLTRRLCALLNAYSSGLSVSIAASRSASALRMSDMALSTAASSTRSTSARVINLSADKDRVLREALRVLEHLDVLAGAVASAFIRARRPAR